jgi:hypothetical protein
MGKPHGEPQYDALAAIHNLQWLGITRKGRLPAQRELPGYASSPTLWRCLACNERFLTSYAYIKDGKRCPRCRPRKERKCVGKSSSDTT